MIAQLEIFPLGTRSDSVSREVAAVVRIIRASRLPYRVGAMGTVIEGDWDRVLALIKRCHQTMRRRAARVMTIITIDDRREPRRRHQAPRMERKLRSLERRLGARLD